MEKETYLLPSSLRSRVMVSLSVGGLLVLAGVLINMADGFGGSPWTALGTAGAFLILAVWVLVDARRIRWLLKTKVLARGTMVINSNARGTNQVDLNRPHAHRRVVIPYQTGRAKLHLPFDAYAQSELDWDTLAGEDGLKAVKSYFEAGVVLLPRELEEKMPQPF